ncbi:MAG TPA: hypothetical protein VME92_12110 [Acetobacteraceae bacterium]|nr:hypothetical protein [Acetobacteraceae bacterium]
MALTDAQRTDVRRFCGYPAYGAGVAGNMGWRFYQAYGALEYRMTNLSDAELAVVSQYLVTLNALEAAVPAAGDNLDTDQAAVWTHNRDEVRDRTRLMNAWCRRLCAFLGVPPGDGLQQAGLWLIV